MFGSFKELKDYVLELKNASSYFQVKLDMLIDKVQICIYSYQYDFIFGSNSFKETCEKLKKILQTLSKYNLTLSPSECSF